MKKCRSHAVQWFRLLLILPLDLLVIFLQIYWLIIDALSNSHTYKRVTTNTVVQIKPCNRSCQKFVSLIAHGWNTDCSATALVNCLHRGIWAALAAIRSDYHPCLDTRPHSNNIKVSHWLPARYWLMSTAKTAWRRAKDETYLPAEVYCRFSVRNSQGMY